MSTPENTLSRRMPPLLPKIIGFWAVVHVVLWLLNRAPHSRVTKIAFAWQGPFPNEGEPKSSYYRRKAWFAIGWLAQILTASVAVSLAIWALPKSESTETAALVAMFALTIGAGMSTLGALLAGLVSAKAAVIGPNPRFVSKPPEESSSAEDPQA